MITIKNLRDSKPEKDKPYQVRIDRQSPLGNPFFMVNESFRDKVCDDYKDWILSRLGRGENSFRDDKICDELNRLYNLYVEYGKLELFCWCAPKRCHGETVKELLLED